MQVRKDIMGKEPKEGDIIVYNPPGYKGLLTATVVGFAKSGLPIIVDEDDLNYYYATPEIRDRWKQTPKTGFAIVQS